ncbi:MAG: hypothetical protein JWN20_440 [Jatrophihabitantaceae bacterium]|nr:hypothetical protein [Jatrophihabitantaceae bacterium]
MYTGRIPAYLPTRYSLNPKFVGYHDDGSVSVA